MTNRYTLWYQLRIITIVFVSIIFLSFMWIYIYQQSIVTQGIIITNWTTLQYRAVEELVREVTSSSVSREFDDHVVQAVVPQLKLTETSYGFFYKNGKIVFENNAKLTRKYKNETLRNTYGAYSYQGGRHLIEVVEIMEKKKSGIDYFIKNHFKGKEYATWVVFHYEGNDYILGMVTPEAYILNQYKYQSIKNNVYAFAGIYTFIIILFASMLCFSSYRFNHIVGELEQDNDSKSALVREKNAGIAELVEKFRTLSMYDFLTGVYNRKFFDVFISKLNDRIFLPISVCIIDIDKFKSINTIWGYEKGDEVLKQTVEVCKEICSEDDVVARYGNDEFALLMINTSSKQASEKAQIISEMISQIYREDMNVSISFGIATKDTDKGSVHQTVIEAEKNLSNKKL